MIRKFKVATVAMIAALSLIATPLVSASDVYPPPQRTISTTGSGIVTVEPDMATFSVGMEARNEEMKLAQDEVTEEANAITAMLLEAGVDDSDIRTSSYRVTPENKYDRNGNFVRIEHYVVRMTISITVHDIDLVGELLDQSVALGADFVSSISFSVSNPDPHIQEARQLAIADAKQKAEDYALGSDSKLTGLFTLWESSSPQPTARESSSADMAMPIAQTEDADMSMESNPVDISAGTTTFIVKVETTWTIEPNIGVISPDATPEN